MSKVCEGIAGLLRARGTRGLRRPSFDARNEPRPLYPHWRRKTTEQVGLNGSGRDDLPARQAPTIKQWSLDVRRQIISASHLLEVKPHGTDASHDSSHHAIDRIWVRPARLARS